MNRYTIKINDIPIQITSLKTLCEITGWDKRTLLYKFAKGDTISLKYIRFHAKVSITRKK